MIGLVGESGAGKSTVINLLMRLYDTDEGEILIDGVDIKDYDPETLHGMMGVVLQGKLPFLGNDFRKHKIFLSERFSRAGHHGRENRGSARFYL